MARHAQQRGHDAHRANCRLRWVLHHRLVRVRQTCRRVGFYRRPDGSHFELVGIPGGLEEFKVAKKLDESLPGGCANQLPGQLVDLARADLAGGEIVGDAQVGRLLGLLTCQVAVLDSLAQVIVKEAEQARAAGERGLGSQEERRPVGARQWLPVTTKKVEQLGLGEAMAGSP